VTVAAVILAATPESALADADGLPAVRRIADAAWSGGATPIVVVAVDPDGRVATALAGAAVTLAEPAPTSLGPAGQMARGLDVAVEAIREATGALLWPARMTWVGPETVTSLIETHGTQPEAILVPRHDGETGWPVLVPIAASTALREQAGDRQPDDRQPDEVVTGLAAAGMARLELDLGDPGTTHDRETARGDLPPYIGPLEPPAGHVHEWGAALADAPDDGPLEGPSLAPYAPAGSSEPAG
jgi:CTP:molybdopterin cytidylyltransferase MocA